ncbi:MAG: putative lipoic acid-binding regulatory protein [Myxococcota bacterium]|jgi:putative lipoic acid-binding regulatory protein
MSDATIGDTELELEYPCSWTYTIMGEDEPGMRAACAEITAGRKATVAFSKRSSGGRYTSLHVELQVASEEDRQKLGGALHQHATIKMML